MRTIGDLVAQVRGILQDTQSQVRYSETDVYEAFNSSLAELQRMRPDVFYGMAYSDPMVYTSSDASKDFPLDLKHFTPLVYFIVGYLELRDDQFTVDGRAATLLTKFEQYATEGSTP